MNSPIRKDFAEVFVEIDVDGKTYKARGNFFLPGIFLTYLGQNDDTES